MIKQLTATFFFGAMSLLTANVNAAKVEIALIDKVDGVTSEYCIDIKGGNRNIDITKGLQSHTCYSYRGEIGIDQAFEAEKFTDNVLYMPNFDVCATLSSLEAGATVGLATCDESEVQMLVFSEEGTISPKSAPEMCLTAGDDTRFGRSKKHQIKTLTLEMCSDDAVKRQQWKGRESS